MTTENRGLSYKDPMYDEIEAGLEQELNLPQGGIAAIRTRGERSNADQVSSAGARTVYQITPTTRKLFLDKYDVDAYESPEAAARVAALHLRESMDRNGGDWAEAVGEYHGGTDRSNWGPINEAYRQRVLGEAVDTPESAPFTTPTPEQLFRGNFADSSFAEMDIEVPTAGEVIAEAMGDLAVSEEAVNLEADNRKALEERKERLDDISAFDRLRAEVTENALQNRMMRSLDRMYEDDDPEYNKYYLENWRAIEAPLQSAEEVALMREVGNFEEERIVRQQILRTRKNAEAQQSAASPTGLAVGVGLLDPVGWLAGLGVGKAFHMGGVGSVALRTQGRTYASVASAAGEGAVGNLAITAGLDATGDYVTPGEYGLSALLGLGIGAGVGIGGNLMGRDDAMAAAVQESREALQAQRQVSLNQARQELGPDATDVEVSARAAENLQNDYLAMLEYALADIPENQKLASPEALEPDAALQQRVTDSGDVAGVSDDGERALVEDTIARAIRISDDNPVDTDALRTVLANEKIGLESTSNRLLQSDSPVYRAVGVLLLENPQGAAGRQRSAALQQHIRERSYNQRMRRYDALSNQYSRREGIGIAQDFLMGRGRNQFNREVMIEVEKRLDTPEGTSVTDNPYVAEAADIFETGMTMMRLEQQKVGVVGAARLGDTSRGYVPHRLDPRMVAGLNNEQLGRVRTVLARQFETIDGFDREFSEKLAKKYIERGQLASHGAYAVPMNLQTPEAADIVRDALQGMDLDGRTVEELMGKFARGGAGHTKKRLKLDLMEDIGDGMQLIDLFVTDVPSLYRSYARRASGEVALAQYGVMGKKGLDVLRRAAVASGAKPEETEAFDQIASELLNTPYANAKNYNWLDNLRLMTSASRLGGMAFTQFSEFGNVIPALGVDSALRGVSSMPRMIREVREMVKTGEPPNDILRDFDQMGGGVGMEDFNMTRMFDVKDNSVELYNGSDMGLFSRGLRAGAHANMVLSGQRLMMAAQTRFMAEEILRKSFKLLRDGGDTKAFDDMGIDEGLRKAMLKDMDRVAQFGDDGRLVALNMRESSALTPRHIAQLQQAIERGSAQIIQKTFTGETGKWMHDGFLKMLFQFRTFGITAIEKQWGRNRFNYGAMKSALLVLATASFAAPIYIARVGLRTAGMDDKRREEYLERNLTPFAVFRASMNYASSAGLTGDVMDLGVSGIGSFGGDLGEELGLGDISSRAGQNAGTLQGMVPGIGAFNDAISGDPWKTARLLPGASNPLATPIIEALRAASE